MTNPRRGEVWLVDWAPGRGSEQSGQRPAVVVQNDYANLSTVYPNTIVVALSRQGRDVPFHVFVRKSGKNGLRADSYAKCEQILTISKDRLVGKAWGRLSPQEMRQIDVAMLHSLGVDPASLGGDQAEGV